MERRTDTWIKNPSSALELVEFLGKHLVAYPFGREEDKAGGQFITMDPTAQTVSLRRYDTGEVRDFPWATTHFRYSTEIASPFADLATGSRCRFEWFRDADGGLLEEPVSLVGTVDLVKPDEIQLWVLDARYDMGGWWAPIKAENVARHALRRIDLNQTGEW